MGPSPIAVRGEKAYTYDGEEDFSTPKEATHADIKDLIADYVQAAKNAMAAGVLRARWHTRQTSCAATRDTQMPI